MVVGMVVGMKMELKDWRKLFEAEGNQPMDVLCVSSGLPPFYGKAGQICKLVEVSQTGLVFRRPEGGTSSGNATNRFTPIKGLPSVAEEDYL